MALGALKLLPKKAAADAVSAATVNPDGPNVLDAMVQLEQARTRAKVANKLYKVVKWLSCASILAK
jgi:hypothetical protein